MVQTTEQQWGLDVLQFRLPNSKSVIALGILEVSSRKSLAIRVGTYPSTDCIIQTLQQLLEDNPLPQVIYLYNSFVFDGNELKNWALQEGIRLNHFNPSSLTTSGLIERLWHKLKQECSYINIVSLPDL